MIYVMIYLLGNGREPESTDGQLREATRILRAQRDVVRLEVVRIRWLV